MKVVRVIKEDFGTAELIAFCELAEHASFSDPWEKDAFSELLSNHFMHIMIALENGTPVGYAALSVIFEDAEIMRICILPQFRHKGLGTKFLSCLKDYFKENGAENVFLEVRSSNENAIKLYENAGFKWYGRRKKYYSNGEDAENYKLEL